MFLLLSLVNNGNISKADKVYYLAEFNSSLDNYKKDDMEETG